MCSVGAVLCHQVATVGPYIHHRTGTDGGLESFLLVTLGIWESPLNYSESLNPHLKNAEWGWVGWEGGDVYLPRALVKASRTNMYKVPNTVPATQEGLGICKETEYTDSPGLMIPRNTITLLKKATGPLPCAFLASFSIFFPSGSP